MQADQVKERPILFSAPMVRALLAGTKTQTRRMLKPQPSNVIHQLFIWKDNATPDDELVELSPYGKPGERLWVRETFGHMYRDNSLPDTRRDDDIVYRADGFRPDEYVYGSWSPSIHMPRWASRILLEITEVRVERLRSISEADALAEGIVRLPDGGFGLPKGEHYHAADPRISYLSLWESINGPGSVEADPWVWAVSFRRLTP